MRLKIDFHGKSIVVVLVLVTDAEVCAIELNGTKNDVTTRA